jgi:hypothetical protein
VIDDINGHGVSLPVAISIQFWRFAVASSDHDFVVATVIWTALVPERSMVRDGIVNIKLRIVINSIEF